MRSIDEGWLPRTTLSTAEVAQTLGVADNTVKLWDRSRYLLPFDRSKGRTYYADDVAGYKALLAKPVPCFHRQDWSALPDTISIGDVGCYERRTNVKAVPTTHFLVLPTTLTPNDIPSYQGRAALLVPPHIYGQEFVTTGLSVESHFVEYRFRRGGE